VPFIGKEKEKMHNLLSVPRPDKTLTI